MTALKRSENSSPVPPSLQPLLIVLSGQSGVGKDTVLEKLKTSGLSFEHIVTVTTRPRRPKEKDGLHYSFVTNEEFQRMIGEGRLLEWAKVYGHWYGPPKDTVKKALEAGKDVVLKIDVQGAATIKKKIPEAVFIFLAAPSMADLEQRLKARRTESKEDLELRLNTAREEMKQLPIFDYIVYNRPGELDRAVEDIRAIIKAEKSRVKPREIVL